MHIIPAIDLIGGACVRLTQGDYDQKTEYNSDPLAVAKEYESAGLRRLHLVDLDGAKQRKIVNLPVLERIASQTGLQVDFGGGVQSDEDLQAAFAAGAHQITGGSIAVRQPEMFARWLQQWGPERIILGADVRGREIAIGGWQEGGGIELMPFLQKYSAMGVRYVICTDVSKDGLLQGPSLRLYQEILAEFPGLHLIASGGVATLDDLHQLRDIGCWGCIVGKAIYENRISIEELVQFESGQ
ncbi:1-(5-phosphoribosyl)-5-[(5-phosphoribosylamino)methylideneamino]imidazole-4-carboxamide isomerase [Cesiribacter andamanensis]|uniref:1-(5-phosphoribosyl)-5-[(5-phosphoribosylamino)methylideneamino] imidazole-4-carboxamide isomerase n=1 Tax=Cesiribacter andamanensis AMV16 TaxID=1279009 RepID=M7N7Z4_9BACT|nr:1-(5-phosphoribosyl)-5-[(5-phosphoribosylamino)methylideneamino]imidazole-4-carboxamide isomerase [Cesiribacter andamanensis]EMR03372.1 1-(5-phosphoribosyl)-5-[(5-phosphoribosylamino)methylideneamino] imidazole-4-carboxamide isomerase [Cesiribacter andamanensis AMV16]